MSALHSHEGFDVPAETTPLGVLDHELLGDFIAAAIDGCTACQPLLLGDMAEDPATACRLVELACIAVHERLGGLPPSLLVGGSDPRTVAFRELAATGLNGRRDEMYAGCDLMTVPDRAAAVEVAADLLVGLLLTTMHPMPPFPTPER